MANKFYAVQQGKVPGVYHTWEECKAQVHGYSGAVYKSFPTAEEAMQYLSGQETRGDLGISANSSPGQGKPGNAGGQPGMERQLVAYVDGSYYSATGEFSYGVVILQNGSEHCFSEKLSDPELAAMHNVAGEIKGAEAAMRYALEHGYSQITIYHDYEGIAKWCTGAWKANKSGTKAYKAYYDSISGRLRVSFEKVKGHSGDQYNDMADRLAKKALGL